MLRLRGAIGATGTSLETRGLVSVLDGGTYIVLLPARLPHPLLLSFRERPETTPQSRLGLREAPLLFDVFVRHSRPFALYQKRVLGSTSLTCSFAAGSTLPPCILDSHVR